MHPMRRYEVCTEHCICKSLVDLGGPMGNLGSKCWCCCVLTAHRGMLIVRDESKQHAGKSGAHPPAATDKASGDGEAIGTGVSPGTGVAAAASAGDGDAGGPVYTGSPLCSCSLTALHRVTRGIEVTNFEPAGMSRVVGVQRVKSIRLCMANFHALLFYSMLASAHQREMQRQRWLQAGRQKAP